MNSDTPNPPAVTREEAYLANIAGVEGVTAPEAPLTRVEYYLDQIMKSGGGGGGGGGTTNYNALSNKPKVNGVVLEGNKTASDLGISAPTKTSELTNDSGYITKAVNDLANYTTTTNMNTALGNKADTSAVLTKTNTTSYTPSANYHPATKKYVDDTASSKANSADVYTKTEVDTKLLDYAPKKEEVQIHGWTSITPDTNAELDIRPQLTAGYTRFTILVYLRKGSLRQGVKFELTSAELEKIGSKATTNMVCITRSCLKPDGSNAMANVKQCVTAKKDANNNPIFGDMDIKYQLYDVNGTVISGLDNFEWCLYAE